MVEHGTKHVCVDDPRLEVGWHKGESRIPTSEVAEQNILVEANNTLGTLLNTNQFQYI